MSPVSHPSYRPTALASATASARRLDSNPTVANVRDAYSRIRTDGDYLRAWDGGEIPAWRYTANIENNLGLGNHFQGIQRLARGRYVVISGADPNRGPGLPRASHLFVVRMGSRRARGPWGSNIVTKQRPPAADRIVRTICMDRRLWHAGGISVCGDVLAVPIESSSPERSHVVFYDMRDPKNPREFPRRVKRSRAKAGAAALTRLSNDHYVLAVWSDSDSKPRRLDFYLSTSTDLIDGFRPGPVTWYARDVQAGEGQDANFSNFQAVNFVNQSDGRLYLIGLHNTSTEAPTRPGRDYADLYAVELGDGAYEEDPVLGVPTITKVGKRQFFCNDQQCNMDGAAGVYIDKGGEMHVYAAWHWRSDNLVRFNEYRSTRPTDAPPITRIGDAWIDLFEHRKFAGRRLSIIGRQNHALRHFGEIAVQGSAFEEKVSSVRFQMPPGYEYALYEGRKYTGDILYLCGTGHVEEIPDLARSYGFGDKVSSARYEP